MEGTTPSCNVANGDAPSCNANECSCTDHQPLVSVLMAAYNPGKYLIEAVRSILSQTYQNWELVVLDDASMDDTWKNLQSFAAKDSRVRIFQNDHNLGFSGTRNRLFTLMDSKAEFIAVLDSDDVALPTRLQMQVSFLQKHPEIGAVGSSIIIIDENSSVTSFRRYPSTPEAVRSTAMKSNPMAHSTLMIRRSVQLVLGDYGTRLSCCEDYDYLLRMLEVTSYTNLEAPQVAYRISSTQWTKRRIRHSLLVSQAVQRRYLFRRGYFSLSALLSHCARYLLALVPQRLVLWLFFRLTYRPCPAEYTRLFATVEPESVK